MKRWSVRVRATVVKDIEVDAETQEKAEELAHQQFSVECDGAGEKYNQEVEFSEVLEDVPCV